MFTIGTFKLARTLVQSISSNSHLLVTVLLLLLTYLSYLSRMFSIPATVTIILYTRVNQLLIHGLQTRCIYSKSSLPLLLSPIDKSSSSSIISLLLSSTTSSCSTRLNVVVLDSGSYPTAEARNVAVNMPGITVSPSSSPSAPSAPTSNVYEMLPSSSENSSIVFPAESVISNSNIALSICRCETASSTVASMV